jgi:hypothetical protein
LYTLTQGHITQFGNNIILSFDCLPNRGEEYINIT